MRNVRSAADHFPTLIGGVLLEVPIGKCRSSIMRQVSYFTLATLLAGMGLIGAQEAYGGEPYSFVWALVMWVFLPPGILLGLFGAYFWFTARHDNAEPNLPLATFATIRLGAITSWAQLPQAKLARQDELLAQIREKARQDLIAVWGRKNCTIGADRIPLTRIPQDYWELGELELTRFIDGGGRLTGCTRADLFGYQSDYTDLWLNRAQVDRHWRKRRSWPKFRSPIVFEKACRSEDMLTQQHSSSDAASAQNHRYDLERHG